MQHLGLLNHLGGIEIIKYIMEYILSIIFLYTRDKVNYLLEKYMDYMNQKVNCVFIRNHTLLQQKGCNIILIRKILFTVKPWLFSQTTNMWHHIENTKNRTHHLPGAYQKHLCWHCYLSEHSHHCLGSASHWTSSAIVC